jgi:ABC-2 type transport system permease protein
MRALVILLAKELHATVTSPVAYAVGGVFLLVLGYTFSLTLFFTKVANLTYIFHQMYVLLILLVPVLTMRAFAEERKMDTLELLLTAPVREVWIVLAKFLAALLLVLALLLVSVAYPLIVALYGEPDWGPIYGGYLALGLLACLLVSVGMFASSLTDNQVVAASVSLGAFLMLWFADSVAYILPAPLDLFFINLSLIGHFTPFVSGSMFLSDVGYYLSLAFFALFMTTRVLADR